MRIDKSRERQLHLSPLIRLNVGEKHSHISKVGMPFASMNLNNLIDALNRASFHPHLNLQQRLDRLMPGLGADLFAATA